MFILSDFLAFLHLGYFFVFFFIFFRNIHERDRERKRSKRMKFIRINVFGGHYLIVYMWHISITLKIYCSFFFLFLLLFCFAFFLLFFFYDENNTEIFWDVSLCIDWRHQKHNLNLNMTRLGRVYFFSFFVAVVVVMRQKHVVPSLIFMSRE